MMSFLLTLARSMLKKSHPAMNELLNEQIRKGMKYTYYACWASGMLGMLFTMIITNLIMGAY